ncbi:hypothetical protein [Enterococcus phage EFLK1]|uniref:Sigma factor n=1 Tax=Enterococcus phage EFLK1 TaxID=1640885 RepID=A0A347UYH3_9CAUD|nr:RNA polymerase sigma factor [Enterococcus phage EFLK1]AXY05416.1 hypothetical protein [Enterococcus phage EFLK1]
MSRDVQKEEKEIRNGNRFITETHGKGVFPRDVDRLYHKYSNLRYKVYNTHKDSFNSEASRKELKSYIDEQFIKLTKEYDINGEVDFPGYIKKALNLRVRHSYVKGRFRDTARERLGTQDNEVELLLGIDDSSQADIEDAELIESLLSKANFSEIELAVFQQLIQGTVRDARIITELSEKYGVSKKAVKDAIKNVREFVLINLTD